MSFYLNMLREEEDMLSGNTGFDDSLVANSDDEYETDLKKTAEIIEDINADYSDQSSQPELDAQDLQENPVEECAMMIFESQYNWNTIMRAIGTKELLENARGREMVMEAVDVKEFFNKIKEFFVKMWKKFTAFVKNWIDNAMALFRTNKSFVQKYGAKFADGKKAYEADPDKKPMKGYNFKAKYGSFDTQLKMAVEGAQENANLVAKKVGDLSAAVSSGNFDRANELNVAHNTERLRGRLCGKSDEISADSFRKELKIAYFGSEEKETLKDDALNPETIKKSLENSNKDVKDIKKVYDNAKKAFDTTLKGLKRLEDAIRKSSADASEGKSATMNAVVKSMNIEKDNKAAITMSCSMLMKAMKAQKAQCRRVANAWIFALNKSTRKGKIDKLDKQNASAMLGGGFLSNVELI